MYVPVTLNEIVSFINVVFNAFGYSIYYSFVIMLTFAIIHGIKRILVE